MSLVLINSIIPLFTMEKVKTTTPKPLSAMPAKLLMEMLIFRNMMQTVMEW